MTSRQITLARNLHLVKTGGYNWDKSFISNLFHLATTKPEKELSEKQNVWLYRLLYKYRKQLPNTYKMYKNHSECKSLKSKK